MMGKESVRKGTLLLAEIDSLRRQQGKVKLRLKGIPQTITLTDSQFHEMCKSFPRIWARFKKENGALRKCRAAFFGVVYLNKSGEIIVNFMKLTLMSQHYIPCDSFLEVRIANKLVREGRKFLRVLFPSDEGTKYMADFELLDMGTRWVLEVFGMLTIDYLADKQLKKAFWAKVVGDCFWQWDIQESLRKIPKFPPLPAGR
jgi:hypothetical protein